MCDFQRIAQAADDADALSIGLQLDRAEVLRGAPRILVTDPENDETGRFWFFLSGTVHGEPISVPHVVCGTLGRVVNAPRLMEAYRRGIADELRRRGFPVVVDATPAREEPL